MDKIGNILQGHKAPKEPTEIQQIKTFVRKHFDADCRVSLRHNSIIVTVETGALASELQLMIPELEESVSSDKRLSIRIGQL
jgi:hypothetical protein